MFQLSVVFFFLEKLNVLWNAEKICFTAISHGMHPSSLKELVNFVIITVLVRSDQLQVLMWT